MKIFNEKNYARQKVYKEVLAAQDILHSYVRKTPLEHSPWLSHLCGGRVFLKLENLQLSGSFKFRGALNKILSLDQNTKKREIITASSGNHGAAVAFIMKQFNFEGRIILPLETEPAKVEYLRLLGAKLTFHGHDCLETENFARRLAEDREVNYIPPYNDLKVVAGQGTVGWEIHQQLEELNSILVPVGGGGLAAGTAGYLKAIIPSLEVIGCQPENSAVMAESIKAGYIIETEAKPTLSDGSAGGIESGSITFELCRRLIDEFILVDEKEIKDAILFFLDKHHLLVEGAAALSLAAFKKNMSRFKKKTVVLVVTGSRISLNKLKSLL